MPWVVALFPAMALVYVAAGLAAWTRRPSSRLGLIMIFGGGIWLLAGMVNIDSPALAAVGAITRILGIGVIVHLLISFPTGRLHTRAERLVVAGGYFACLILEIPNWLFAPTGALSVADRPELVDTGIIVLRIAAAIVVAATVAILIGRMRRMTPEQRHVFAPLASYGIFTLLFVVVADEIAKQAFGGGGLALPATQLSVIAFVPVAFAIAASRGGFARTADIAELGSWLASADSARPTLRQALADTLGDPSLRLLFRLPGDETLVDDRGVTVAEPEPDRTRGVVEIELAGEPVGTIVYDAVLLDRPDEVREAGRVIALALDRERLVVELRASRSRLVASADRERRRIARDLHDGLQPRLVFLAVQAGTGADSGTMRSGIETAIDELRDLVDGVMPVQLTERGLAAAVEDLADRMPVPITLDFTGFDHRLEPEIETAAYFIVSEAMVNAVKHSESSTLAVSLARTGEDLSIEVTDSGRGGARPGAGSGMRGMDDRVAALGGRLTVSSSARGTRVMAVIPCAP
ncbi:MAG TPA: ATP-binding protein [Solirubrobacterales bacterium]|nr:ATP-binding protein [Solirubrobacterales bacterium]